MDFPVSSETARLRFSNDHLIRENGLLKEELMRLNVEQIRVSSVVNKRQVPVRDRDLSYALRKELRRVRNELGSWWHETEMITRILDGEVDWDTMRAEQVQKDEELKTLKRVENDVKALNDALKEATQLFVDHERLKGENGELQNAKKRLQKENAEQTRTIRMLQESISKDAASCGKKLSIAPTGRLPDMAQYNEVLTLMAAEIGEHRMRIQADGKQLEELKRETAAANVTIEAGNARIAELEAQTATQRERLARMAAEIDQHQARARADGEQLEELRREKVTANVTIEARDARIAELEAQTGLHQTEGLDRMAGEIRQNQARTRADGERLTELKREKAAADATIEARNARITELEAQTATQTETLARMAGEIEQYHAKALRAAKRQRAAREREQQEQMRTMSLAVRNQMIAVTQQAEWRIARLKEIHAREVGLQQAEIRRLEALLPPEADRLPEWEAQRDAGPD
jgi:chromosome segregation ATPase